MYPLLIFIGTLTFSLMFTAMIRSYALRKNMLDFPNQRSSHVVPTPRGGGAAIVIVFLGFFAAACFLNQVEQHFFLALFVGGLIVALVGFWDDHKPVKARWRLLIHFAAASWAFTLLGDFSLNFFDNFVLPELIWKSAGMILAVWMLNLFNFMDGIDGIASSEAIFVAGGAALIIYLKGGGGEVVLLMALSGACFGFLIWNWPPAMIFMGDGGSGFLGYVLAIFAFYTASRGVIIFWSWMILLGVFFVDATMTLAYRIWKGERFYEAHRSHAYQVLSRKYGSHLKVTLGVVCINLLLLFPLAVGASLLPEYGYWFALSAYLTLIILWLKVRADGNPDR